MLTGGRVLGSPTQNDFTYQWPGTYFRAAFIGQQVFFRIGKNNQILHIDVDGQSTPPLVKPEEGVYQVAGLANSRHTISIFVATESQSAPNTFGGFSIPVDEKPSAAPQRTRQIEFIGDSHTVGYGNTSPTTKCSDAEVWATTDNTKAFAAITANHYNADYQVNAISGRGIVRNYNGFAADTLPQAYPFVLFDHKQPYNDAAWKPQVLVIALGTNDFSTALHEGEHWKTRDELHADYEATYLHFLQQLRAKNPRAYIIVWATDLANGEIESEARKVVQSFQQLGDKHITFAPIHGLSFNACNGHPSLADDHAIAQKLIQLIDTDKLTW